MSTAAKVLLALGLLFWTATGAAQDTAIFEAAGDGDIARIRELLERSPELVNAKGEQGETPLQRAAWEGHLEAVRLFLDRGAEIDGRNDANQTAILFAAYRGYTAIVDTLIARGAAFDYRDQRGNSPFLFAAREGRLDVVQLLLAHGAAPDERGPRGRTPLHLAAMRGHTAIIRILAARGASLENTDEDQQTPLTDALAGGHAEAAEALLEAGASLKLDGRNDARFLVAAAAAGSRKIVNLLIARGASPDSADPRGRTLLHGAAIGGLAEVVRTLAGRGGNLDALDRAGNTPLSYGINEGRRDVVEALLAGGGDPNLPDGTGRTPLQAAEDGCRTDIARLLRGAGARETERPVQRLGSPRHPETGATPAREPVDTTYIGNEGFLVSNGDQKILIDALNENPWRYVGTGERIFGMMTEVRPPFEGVDVCVASHAHADHNSGRMSAALLRRHPRLVYASSPEACDSVLTAAGADSGAIRSRVLAVDPPWNSVEKRALNGVPLEFFGVNHAGPGEPEYKTLATVIEIGDLRLLHLADEAAASNIAHYQAAAASLQDIDIVFADRFFIADSTGQSVLREMIKPSCIILMHARPAEIDEFLAAPNPLHPILVVFREQLERKRFGR